MTEVHVQGTHQRSSDGAALGTWTTILIAFAVTLAVDQWSKWLIVEWLGPDSTSHRWEFAGRFLAFEYVENPGAAFGVLAGQVWLLSFLAILVAVTLYFLFRDRIEHDGLSRTALGLIFGGAAGNLVDRIRIGHVTDFIAIGSWPKFNFADSTITLGLVLITVSLLRDNHGTDRTPGHPT